MIKAIFDLRESSGREGLAEHLPDIDGFRYFVQAEEFCARLETAVRFLPKHLPLRYDHGMLPIFNTAGSVFALYELGGWLALLSECEGVQDAIKTFSNPSQFWATYFEVQVAANFAKVDTVNKVAFHPRIERRGSYKYPDLLIEAAGERLFVECKQIHVIKSTLSTRLLSDLRVIKQAMQQAAWPQEYCLEVEFLGPRREAIELLAVRLVQAAIARACGESTVFDLANCRACVRRNDQPFKLASPANLQAASIRLPNHPVNLADSQHTFLTVYRGGFEPKYRRLLRAAVNDARSQLPETEAAAVCITGISADIGLKLFTAEMPPGVAIVSMWEMSSVRHFYDRERVSFAERFLGPLSGGAETA